MSAEALSTTLQAKAKAIVSPSSTRPRAQAADSAACPIQAREQRAGQVHPPGSRAHRLEQRRCHRQPPEDRPPVVQWRATHQAASPACRSRRGEDKLAAIYTALAQQAPGLRGTTGSGLLPTSPQAAPRYKTSDHMDEFMRLGWLQARPVDRGQGRRLGPNNTVEWNDGDYDSANNTSANEERR